MVKASDKDWKGIIIDGRGHLYGRIAATMKVILILALIAVVASSVSVSEYVAKAKELIRNDTCIRQHVVGNTITDLISLIKTKTHGATNMEVMEKAILAGSQIKAAYTTCKLGEKLQKMYSADPIELTAIYFLLGSKCYQDVGGVLLIADTIIQNPKDIVNDIIGTIFIAAMGYQGIQDCGQWIAFIRSL